MDFQFFSGYPVHSELFIKTNFVFAKRTLQSNEFLIHCTSLPLDRLKYL